MKRTARKYPPNAASRRDDLLLIIGGIVMWALILAPVVRFAGALLSGNLVWTG